MQAKDDEMKRNYQAALAEALICTDFEMKLQSSNSNLAHIINEERTYILASRGDVGGVP